LVPIEARNAYYKGMLAARKGKTLAESPESLNNQCLSMWIAGFNEERAKIEEKEAETALLASML